MSLHIKGKKRFLALALERTGFGRILMALRRPTVMIYNFHRLRDSSSQKPTLFDEGVFGPTEIQFREHLLWLKAHSELISENDLLESLRTGRPLPPRSSMVTFDDGYVDCYTLALPILRELRVPAIFFIPTQSIDERKIGWWDQISYLIKKTTLPRIYLGGQWLQVEGNREGVTQQLFERMKLTPCDRTAGLVDELANACETSLPSFDEVDSELMTWEQIRIARNHGVAIGSHTHTHRVLATLDSVRQTQELRISKAMIERRLGSPVHSIAYPVGGYSHFTRETLRLSKECGYKAAFSFTNEVNLLNSPMDRFNLRRVSAPEFVDYYAGMFALPSLFIGASNQENWA